MQTLLCVTVTLTITHTASQSAALKCSQTGEALPWTSELSQPALGMLAAHLRPVGWVHFPRCLLDGELYPLLQGVC